LPVTLFIGGGAPGPVLMSPGVRIVGSAGFDVELEIHAA